MENTNNENMLIFDQLKSVPDQFKKDIKSGPLQGLTEINAMWRVQRMTEVFGPIGTGWRAEVEEREIVAVKNGTQMLLMRVSVSVKHEDGSWSERIPGHGGAVLVKVETDSDGKEYFTYDDDASKKAFTDALGTACKLLGLGAEVYCNADSTKYNTFRNEKQNQDKPNASTEKPAGKPSGSSPRTRVTPPITEVKTGDEQTDAMIQEVAQSSLPTLTPQSSLWGRARSRAAKSNGTTEAIRKGIEKEFCIDDENFNLLMKEAGKAA